MKRCIGFSDAPFWCVEIEKLDLSFHFASGGRLPRAWLQSPRRFAPAGPSAQASPAGVAAFRFTQFYNLNRESFLLTKNTKDTLSEVAIDSRDMEQNSGENLTAPVSASLR